MAEANFSVFSYRARKAECLKSLANSLGCLIRLAAVFFQRNRCACNIGPADILKTDWLDVLCDFIWVDALLFTDCLRFLEGSDAVCGKRRIDFFYFSVLKKRLFFNRLSISVYVVSEIPLDSCHTLL